MGLDWSGTSNASKGEAITLGLGDNLSEVCASEGLSPCWVGSEGVWY